MQGATCRGDTRRGQGHAFVTRTSYFVVVPYSCHPCPISQIGKLSPGRLSDSSTSPGLLVPSIASLGDFLFASADLFGGMWRWVGGQKGTDPLLLGLKHTSILISLTLR